MIPKLPRWLTIVLIVLAVLAVIGINILLYRIPHPYGLIVGGIFSAILLAIVVFLVSYFGPMLWRWYKFNKYYKENEDSLRQLPHLMQQHRTMAAQAQFEGMMKNAPPGAYIYYMRAFFYQSAEKFPEAYSAAKKALSMVDTDTFLPVILQQSGGQMGQPRTVAEFKQQLNSMCETLAPRVNQMRQRREKSIAQRKKKSR